MVAKLHHGRSNQIGLYPPRGMNLLEFDFANLVAFNFLCWCTDANVVGGVAHAQSFLDGIFEQDCGSFSDVTLVVGALQLQAQLAQHFVSFLADAHGHNILLT